MSRAHLHRQQHVSSGQPHEELMSDFASLMLASAQFVRVQRPFSAVLKALQVFASGVLVLAGLFTAIAMVVAPGSTDSFSTGTGVGFFAAGALVAVLASIAAMLSAVAVYFTSQKTERRVVLHRLGWAHGVALLGFIAAIVVFNVRA